MKPLSTFFIILLCCAVAATAPAQTSDPLDNLKKFSNFQKIDVKRLLGGEILSQRGPLMDFPNGISTQICFFLPMSPEEVFRRQQTWDPTRCAPLKVYASGGLSNPCKPSEFKKLRLDPGNYPVKWLLEKTLTTASGKLELNLTRSEAHELAACVKMDRSPASIGSCWAKLLFARTAAFQLNGLGGVLPYEAEGEFLSPTVQIRTMLQEQAKITQEFAPILHKTGILNDGAKTSSLLPLYNWSFFEANHHATLNLGAVYQLAVGDHYQLLDISYYASSTYYAAATLYEIWPFHDGKKTGALVWRGDFLAAPTLRYTKGIERIAYGAIMIQEIKKEIRCFQDDVRTKP
ncbi:hypothetical protein F6V25_15460 [Oryzomonas japonica]|uniref:Uncharacterized protein n=1 Tax=Oryzomonas japonica TaxID=2603858 RepID=A0A7J4ZMI9_9BACT|nr:hypothetical protein [Oryzomonas japonica]KAB0663825.1 hypothetical protein F6V25_15460 [Oryzomonas japonica]